MKVPRDPAWWKSAVVYQIYPRSFADSNGDGIGDLAGIIGRLDYLRVLGVDVVWLSPIFRSPQADNGYDISDYRDIDPLFGTLAEFDTLVAKVHEHGMKLVMDLVVNHTSDEHPWFVESRSSRDNPKRDWYIWRDAHEGGEPNNWGSFFTGSAWAWEQATDQYYLHLFDSKQPDLNWDNPQVRKAVQDIMVWWLDRGVDGFRMDVINFISKTEGLPDTPAIPGQRFVVAFDGFADGPHVHDYLAEMTREVFSGRDGDFMTVGEMPGVTPEQARLYTDPARGELDMVFQFEHVSVDQGPAGKFDHLGLDLVVLKRSLHRWQAALAETGWNSLYWNNHDQPRVVSRFGDDGPEYWAASAKALATVLHGMRGTPFVYQGEELGMTNYPFRTAQEHKDLEAVNFYKSVLERRWRRRCGAGRSGQGQPRQRPHTNAMGRGTERRLHQRRPVAAGQPELHLAQRRSPDRGNGFGFRALPSAHSSPSRIADPGRRRLHPADGRRPADLGVHQNHPGQETPRDRQLRASSADRRDRPRMDRGRSSARQPARHPGHVDVDVSGPGRLGRAHLLRWTLTTLGQSGSRHHLDALNIS